jgi:type II secretory pathway pseudopilin PulG
MTAQVKNGMATAGMICGIVGIVTCWFPFIGLLAGLLGIVFGAIGMSKAGRLGGVGKGAAITGLVCGIVSFFMTGIMAAIAIPAFLEYMNKSKKSEATLQLRRLEKNLKTHYYEKSQLPPSTETEMPGTAETVCSDQGGHKHPVRSIGEWHSDPGWRALDFSTFDPTPYSFRWTRESPTRGYFEARADLDCDGEISTTRLDIEVLQGNIQATHREPTRD